MRSKKLMWFVAVEIFHLFTESLVCFLVFVDQDLHARRSASYVTFKLKCYLAGIVMPCPLHILKGSLKIRVTGFNGRGGERSGHLKKPDQPDDYFKAWEA